MAKYVYTFAEGNKDMKDLLGGKGANLAEMTNLGLPVPPGFTITTDACRAYLKHNEVPESLVPEVTKALRGWKIRSDAPSETKMSRYWFQCVQVRSSRCRA